MHHYGYYSTGEPTCTFYNNNWAMLKYFVSSQQSAFELSMLQTFDAELFIGQMSKGRHLELVKWL